MTAEVVILNKSAVALAADSTVTIGSDRKTYNSVNKLFTLSKHHPVGVMIYGDAEFLGVPWETIIKEFRRRQGGTQYSTVHEHAESFLAFLEERTDIFVTPQQELESFRFALWYFFGAKAAIDEEVARRTADGTKVTNSEVSAIANAILQKSCEDLESAPVPEYLGAGFVDQLTVACTVNTDTARKSVLDKYQISNDTLAKLPRAIARTMVGGRGPGLSGLVIAGFGESEIFPVVRTLRPRTIVQNRLIWYESSGQSYKVDFANEAALIPFAQQDVVHTILNGCDPDYNELIFASFNELFDRYPEALIAGIGDRIPENDRAGILAKIKEETEGLRSSITKQLLGYRQRRHTDPLLEVIAVLPKDELAAMASALVNLTTIKRKMSLELETVGGPVDVAVISKGDGFIWINRKHYFSTELNPHFTQTYFKGENDVATNR